MQSGRALSGGWGGQGLCRSREWVCLSVPGEASSLGREPSLREPPRPRPAEEPRGGTRRRLPSNRPQVAPGSLVLGPDSSRPAAPART